MLGFVSVVYMQVWLWVDMRLRGADSRGSHAVSDISMLLAFLIASHGGLTVAS
jgi:hypothetical protein